MINVKSFSQLKGVINMNRFKYPTITILIFSFFLISTCTTDNSITGNSDQSLGKTTGVVDINNTAGGDKEWERLLLERAHESLVWMFDNFSIEDFFSQAVEECVYYVLGSEDEEEHNDHIDKSYDFRDNYLAKSDKGLDYIACYYILSKYGIENNLVNKYYKEHYELLKSSIGIAYDLQYSSNNNQVLINRSTADNLKDILKVYRNSTNYREIEPILDYLEADLEKYYNKPKYAISTAFKSN